MASLQGLKRDDGQFESYAWPGGYPLYYLDHCNNVLCPACVNAQQTDYVLGVLSDIAAWCLDPSDDGTYFDNRDLPVAADVNYDWGFLYCDNCSQGIESAYGECQNTLSMD